MTLGRWTAAGQGCRVDERVAVHMSGPPSVPGRVESKTISSPSRLTFGLFEDAPLVAVALRQAGRAAEAERILIHLERQLEVALSSLERAIANGWAYVDDLDTSALGDIGDEPAFRARGDPRFERIRARLNAHLARAARSGAAADVNGSRRRPARPATPPAPRAAAGSSPSRPPPQPHRQHRRQSEQAGAAARLRS